MIDSLQITNIKAHLDSYLQFSPGLNVITGDTNAGKSSVFKILTWTLKNSPRGYNPKPWKKLKASSAPPTSTIKFTDGNIVTRSRSAGDNSLTLNGKVYSALQSKMPDIVSAVINMGAANFQPQEEAFFLVADTGAEAAKKINKIAHLDGMGEVISIAKARVKEAKQQETEHGIKITSLGDQLDEMLWLDDADLDITDLEEREKALLDREKQQNCITRNVVDCGHIHKELSALPPYSCITILNKLRTVERELEDRQNRVKFIDNLTTDIATCRYNVAQINSITEAIADKLLALNTRLTDFEKWQGRVTSIKLVLQELSNINSIIKKHWIIDKKKLGSLISRSNNVKLLENKYKGVAFILVEINKLKSGINSSHGKLEELSRELAVLRKNNPVCPVCGGPLI